MSKGAKVFRFIMITLFVIFATLYISQATGYYDYKKHQNVILTEEKIKQFEQDIKEGKNVDVTEYLEVKEHTYKNGFSQMGLKLSNGVSRYVQKGVNGLFNFLEKLLIG
ncbi:MAG: hypothetical protein PHY26_00245 [Bacilli bacterium]|jgi:cell division protein FtsL|nr:hypothetical protein [Bacilli bacterium]